MLEMNCVSGQALQIGCEIEEKEKFWRELDEVIENIPREEKEMTVADINDYIGEGNRGDEQVWC